MEREGVQMTNDLLQRAEMFAEDCDLYNEPIESMAEFAATEIARERAEIADEIKAALAGEFIDASPSAFRSRFHTIEAKLRAKL